MAKLTEYRVLRPHDGDKLYAEGDTRIADAGDVKHLVGTVLEEIGPAPDEDEAAEDAQPSPEEKAEPEAPANKAVKAAPANKSSRLPVGKSASKAKGK
jgi:hypothetical protein